MVICARVALVTVCCLGAMIVVEVLSVNLGGSIVQLVCLVVFRRTAVP